MTNVNLKHEHEKLKKVRKPSLTIFFKESYNQGIL